MIENLHLIKLAKTRMPFGKYQDKLIIELPEEHLLWFAKKGELPRGELGLLMQLALELKVESLEHLIDPLKKSAESL